VPAAGRTRSAGAVARVTSMSARDAECGIGREVVHFSNPLHLSIMATTQTRPGTAALFSRTFE
jgi:hypothetical protein